MDSQVSVVDRCEASKNYWLDGDLSVSGKSALLHSNSAGISPDHGSLFSGVWYILDLL